MGGFSDVCRVGSAKLCGHSACIASGRRDNRSGFLRYGVGLLFLLISGFPNSAHAEKPGGLRFTPTTARPGDMVKVEVWAGDNRDTAAAADFMENRFVLPGRSQKMARKGLAKRFVGYIGVPIEADPGRYPVTVRVAGRVLSKLLPIRSRTFLKSELKVDRKFTQKNRAPELEARLEREEADMNALWATPPTYAGPPPRLCRPLSKMTRTGRFGTQRVFNGELNSVHYGTDYRAWVGVPVRTIMPGRVVMSTQRFTTGGTVVVDHGRGLFSLYFHFSKLAVRTGQRVRCGQRIGLAGKSGRVTGPHLHLSVVVRAKSKASGETWGMYVEPEQVLSRNWFRRPRQALR